MPSDVADECPDEMDSSEMGSEDDGSNPDVEFGAEGEQLDEIKTMDEGSTGVMQLAFSV